MAHVVGHNAVVRDEAGVRDFRRHDLEVTALGAPCVSRHAGEPRYVQIRHAIEHRIAEGAYAPGSAIPSEHELAAAFSTTRLTVRNAIDGLVERGLIRRVQGKGAFVAQGGADSGSRVSGFRSAAGAAREVASVRQLSKSLRAAGPLYAHLFDIDEGDELYSIRRLNSTDGTPVSLEQTLVPVKLFPGIEDVDVSVFSLYGTYEMCGRPVALAQEKLDVVALSARDAGLLQVEPGSLALSLECVSFDVDGRPIEHAYSLTPANQGGYTYQY